MEVLILIGFSLYALNKMDKIIYALLRAVFGLGGLVGFVMEFKRAYRQARSCETNEKN